MNARPDVEAPDPRCSENRAQETKAADASSVSKRVATLRALLGLHGGHELIELDDGSFAVAKWNLHRRCATIEVVEQFARRIGCPAP
jgi:hypothetical protein